VFAIAVCALIAVSGAAAASEATVQWPMFGFDTARQGRSPTRFPDSVLGKEWSTPPPRTLYQYTGGTPYWSEPCVGVVEGKGRVFIGCYDNNLYAFNARTGEEAWVFTAGDAVSATPVYAEIDGRPMLFVAASDRSIYALDPRDDLPPGTPRRLWQLETFPWRHTVNPSRMADPLLATIDGEPRLFCGVWNNDQSGTRNIQRGELIAIHPKTGVVAWRKELGTGAISTPCLGTVGDEPALFVPYQPGGIYALSTRDGRELWDEPYAAAEELYGGVSVARVQERQLLFFGGRTAWAYCLDAETGEQLWAVNVGTWVDSTPAFATIDGEPTVFFGTYTYFIYACNALTGKVKWGYRTKGIIQGSPALATMAMTDQDGTTRDERVVCINSMDDHVYVVRARDGEFIFRHFLGDFPWLHYLKGRTIWSSCVVATVNGTALLIAPSYSGVVTAFAVNGKDANAGPPEDSFWEALGESYTIPVLIVVAAALVITLRRLIRAARRKEKIIPI
jgi:outer membrane protein assembly factor BamB